MKSIVPFLCCGTFSQFFMAVQPHASIVSDGAGLDEFKLVKQLRQ